MPIPPAISQDFLDFLPLFPLDDEDAILGRMIVSANEGLDPANPGDRWVDTREGGHWRTTAVPGVREIARLYDLAGTEVVMAAMPIWAWGQYLDDHALVTTLTRLPATQATGTVVFTGPENTEIAAGTQVTVNPASADDPVPLFQTTEGGIIPAPVAPATEGVLELPIAAVEAGETGNVGEDAIVAQSTPLPAGVTFTNPDATTGGTDPETDEALRARLLDQYVAGQGGGNVLDYKRWAEEEPGVGHATVIPVWNGPGTVLVIVTGPDGSPVAAGTIASLQNRLDPEPGQGHGEAPIDHTVTVETATALAIVVAAEVEHEDGYTLEGGGGTIATREDITAALEAYLATVLSGDEVVVAQVTARIVTVPGVHDVANVTVNGAGANVPVPAGAAPKVPILTVPVTLVEA